MASRGFPGFDSVSLISCLVANNNSSNGSGLAGQFDIVNCTVASNLGGSVLAASGADSGPSTIKNSIFYFNAGTIVKTGTSLDPQVTYSIIQNGYEGPGNIDVNPLFVDADPRRLSSIRIHLQSVLARAVRPPVTDIMGISSPKSCQY